MMNFICFSINNWEKRKARKQQFMLSLSKRKDVAKVLYVEPALNFFRLLLFPFMELKNNEQRARWKRALTLKPEKLSDKLFIFTPVFFIPFSFRVQAVYNFNLFFLLFQVRGLIKELKLENIVLWLYHPFDYCFLSWFKEGVLSVFDWAEDWAEYFSNYSQKKRNKIRELEKIVIARADIAFVVSQRLLERAAKINVNTYKIGDGTSPEIFLSKHLNMPQDIKDISRPIIGYIGAISFRLEIGLLEELCKEFSECSFVFVGNMLLKEKDIESLKKQRNAFFLGTKDYNDLPGYLLNFDVNILPYVPVPYTSAPTKVFDYLMTGKPIVSTYFSELDRFSRLIYLAKDKAQFIMYLKSALNENDHGLVEERIKTAKENSWDVRTNEIMDIIYQQLEINGKE
ncbi:MAG: hypothetical protein HY810_04350 [Candidatus Omnitrophica bacterium]|nr:hypothetical protein [Candidatus Omnitrophota bacterium]